MVLIRDLVFIYRRFLLCLRSSGFRGISLVVPRTWEQDSFLLPGGVETVRGLTLTPFDHNFAKLKGFRVSSALSAPQRRIFATPLERSARPSCPASQGLGLEIRSRAERGHVEVNRILNRVVLRPASPRAL